MNRAPKTTEAFDELIALLAEIRDGYVLNEDRFTEDIDVSWMAWATLAAASTNLVAFPSTLTRAQIKPALPIWSCKPVGSPIIHMSAITPWSAPPSRPRRPGKSYPGNPPDLGLFNLADHAGYDKIALELNTCFLYRRYRLDIAGKSRLHVDQTPAVDSVVFDHRPLRVVEVIHMSAKHECRAAAGSF